MRLLDTKRLPAAYRYLVRLTPSGWAWEFLRRNPAYRAAMAHAAPTDDLRDAPEAARWGLYFRRTPRPAWR